MKVFDCHPKVVIGIMQKKKKKKTLSHNIFLGTYKGKLKQSIVQYKTFVSDNIFNQNNLQF